MIRRTIHRLPLLISLFLLLPPAGAAQAATPVINSITPERGAVGSQVTILGSSFTGVTDVSFGDVGASFTVDSDEQITATVPSGATVAPITVSSGEGSASSVPYTVQPNIVLILTDDQRYDETSFMPTLQSGIVGRGVTFDRGFVSDPLCCPSRTSILTGRYSHSTDIYQNVPPHGGFQTFLDAGEEDSTIATWLQAGGYRTGLVGKYLNGYEKEQTAHVPPGWDTWDALAAPGSGGYYDYWMSRQGVAAFYGEAPEDYSTDVLAADADTFIRSTPSATPLFLYFAPKAPHQPDTAPPRYATACQGLSIPTPPSFNEADVSDKPMYIQRKSVSSSTQLTHTKQCRSLLAVDDAIGGILSALQDTGRLTDSLIVFMTDNGVERGEHRWQGKEVPYESSIHVPFIVRYDSVRAGMRPFVSHRLVLNVDLAPTFAAAAAVDAPGAEGMNLLPLLTRSTSSWRTSFLIEHWGGSVPAYCGVRNVRYKYVEYATGEQELYDLANDPYELENKAGDPDAPYPTVLATLHRRLLQLCDPPPPDFTP